MLHIELGYYMWNGSKIRRGESTTMCAEDRGAERKSTHNTAKNRGNVIPIQRNKDHNQQHSPSRWRFCLRFQSKHMNQTMIRRGSERESASEKRETHADAQKKSKMTKARSLKKERRREKEMRVTKQISSSAWKTENKEEKDSDGKREERRGTTKKTQETGEGEKAAAFGTCRAFAPPFKKSSTDIRKSS